MKKQNLILCSLLLIISNLAMANCGPDIKLNITVDGKPATTDTIVMVGQKVDFRFSNSLGYSYLVAQLPNDKSQNFIGQKTAITMSYVAKSRDIKNGITASVFFDPKKEYNYKTTKSCVVTLGVLTKSAMEARKNETPDQQTKRVLREFLPVDDSSRAAAKEKESTEGSSHRSAFGKGK